MREVPLRVLLRRATQLAEHHFARKRTEQMSPRQYDILRAVSAIGPCDQTTVVEATGIDRSTLAEVVYRLAKGGMLSQKVSRADRRAKVVAITKGGETALQEYNANNARVEKLIREAVNGHEQLLRQSLERIVNHLDQDDK